MKINRLKEVAKKQNAASLSEEGAAPVGKNRINGVSSPSMAAAGGADAQESEADGTAKETVRIGGIGFVERLSGSNVHRSRQIEQLKRVIGFALDSMFYVRAAKKFGLYPEGEAKFEMCNDRNEAARRLSDWQASQGLRPFVFEPRRAIQINGLWLYDYILDRVKTEHWVDIAWSLSGWRPSRTPVKQAGKVVLVTPGFVRVEPEQGDWSMIKRLIDRSIGWHTPEQVDRFKLWCRVAWQNQYKDDASQRLMLMLIGGPNAYKSRLQENVITPLLGGRYCSLGEVFAGNRDFNAELFEAEHLLMEDLSGSDAYEMKKHFGEAVKKFTVCLSQQCHPKGHTPVNVRPIWAITLSCNDDGDALGWVPEMDTSIKDKLLVLRAVRHDDGLGIPLDTPEARYKFQQICRQQISAFLWHLLNEFTPGSHLQSERTGVAPYMHPELQQAVREESPAFQLLGFLTSYVNERIEMATKGRQCEGVKIKITDPDAEAGYMENGVTEWYSRLHDKCPATLRALCRSVSYLGRNLKRLCTEAPNRVSVRLLNGRSVYRVKGDSQ